MGQQIKQIRDICHILHFDICCMSGNKIQRGEDRVSRHSTKRPLETSSGKDQKCLLCVFADLILFTTLITLNFIEVN